MNINKNNIMNNKKEAINKLDNMLNDLINTDDLRHNKKANLLSYWLKTFVDYLKWEDTFDYTKISRFKRGEIISINLGFNVGSEQGGLHYAIVLDNDNKQSSPVLTVIPLSSGDEGKAHKNDVYLGNELYDKLVIKYNKLLNKLTNELEETNRILNALKNSLQDMQKVPNKINELTNDLEKRTNSINAQKQLLTSYEKDISKMKEGSIALIGQITTVSKMRIYKPKNSYDLLYNVKFSDGAMDKINKKILELFIHQS